MVDESGPYFYPGIEAVRGDIKTDGDACDGMVAINNLFERFNFELFGITFTAHGHLSFKSS